MAASIPARERVTRSRVSGATATRAPCRATETTSAMVRERPSRVTKAGIVAWKVGHVPAARQLPRACDDDPRLLGGRQVAVHHELGVAGVGLEAPVEDQEGA